LNPLYWCIAVLVHPHHTYYPLLLLLLTLLLWLRLLFRVLLNYVGGVLLCYDCSTCHSFPRIVPLSHSCDD
jgi:hypothetical protein